MSEPLPLEQALAEVLARATPLAPERVSLEQAAGRYLAEEGRAVVDLPPFASSAMDGYAIRASDTPGTLPVVFRIAAGKPATEPLEPGEAMGIATGGVVPDGADAVVPLEDVVLQDNNIEIPAAAVAGANIRPRAGDVAAGDVVGAAGVRVEPSRLGALAAAGVAELVCGRRPRVAVLATGTELRRPGEPLGPGEVYEANGMMLAAQLARAGAVVDRLDAVTDDEDAHRAAIERGLGYDLLVTSGGVSVGPHDLVRRVEAELGVEEIFWRVAIRPGRPVSFGVRGATLVFGLPGNPVSSLVGCELFVCPAVRALQGAADPGPFFEPGTLAGAVRRGATRDDLVRARLRAGLTGPELEPITGQESHMIVRSAVADALVHVPRGDGELPAGTAVRYLRLTA